MAAASPLWTDEQQRWLRALGHAAWVGAGEVDGAPDVGRGRVAPADEGPGRVAAAVEDRPFRDPRPIMPPPVESPGAVAAVPARPGAPVSLGDPLFRAILRSTRCRTPAEGQALLAGLVIEPDALRADATAKRALWKALRALRKAGA